jgi:hypothetical protein
MFGASGLIFADTEADESHFHVLRFRTVFKRYRECHISFSCFALLNPFWAVRRALGPIFMLRALRLIFRSTEGVF